MADKKEVALGVVKFLTEMSRQNKNIQVNMKGVPWYLEVETLPKYAKYITVFSYGEIEDDADGVLIRVKKPEDKVPAVPAPPASIRNWLKPGWEDPDEEPSVMGSKDTAIGTVEFSAEYARVGDYEDWARMRENWQREIKIHRESDKIFKDLYEIYTEHKVGDAPTEILASDGFVTDKNLPNLDFPIMLRRVVLKFNAVANSIEVCDAGEESRLNIPLLKTIEGLSLDDISAFETELKEQDINPLGGKDTDEYLSKFTNTISSDSSFSGYKPETWNSRILVYRNPVIMVCNRADGTVAFLEEVRKVVEELETPPGVFMELVNCERSKCETHEAKPTAVERLAAAEGHCNGISFSGKANGEQLEVIRRSLRNKVVLVQGPPGTGKTDTAANLVEQLRKEGYSVLVTSMKDGPLGLVKQRVQKQIRDICVTLVDGNNEDFFKAIDRIVEYQAEHTSEEMLQEAEKLDKECNITEQRLDACRQKVLEAFKDDQAPVKVGNVEMTAEEASVYLDSTVDTLGYIPGNLKQKELPLTMEEFAALYSSNVLEIGEDPENLSDFEALPNPNQFEKTIMELSELAKEEEKLLARTGWGAERKVDGSTEVIVDGKAITLTCSDEQALQSLLTDTRTTVDMPEWQQQLASDGLRGGSRTSRYTAMANSIEAACQLSERVIEKSFGHTIEISENAQLRPMLNAFSEMSRILSEPLGSLKLEAYRRVKPDLRHAVQNVIVDGHEALNKADCELVVACLTLENVREECARYWKELIEDHGGPAFYDLDEEEPEQVAKEEWLPRLQEAMDWYQGKFITLRNRADILGLGAFIPAFAHGSVKTKLQNMIEDLSIGMKQVVMLRLAHLKQTSLEKSLCRWEKSLEITTKEGPLCRVLREAIKNKNFQSYKEAWSGFREMENKKQLLEMREELLKKLSQAAPDWAQAIRDKDDIHGLTTLPENISDAWERKLAEMELTGRTGGENEALFTERDQLSRACKTIHKRLVEKMNWYFLLKDIETNPELRQDLSAYKQTVKKIGKGTGKNAKRYKAEARKLMAKCQKAVPVWIMNTRKVVESLNPGQNHFDYVIMDEASQVDITALGILALADHAIIIGDDMQVSPLGIGIEVDKVQKLESIYLKGLVPNSHLYMPDTSLYDLALTTCRPTMLKEHFRCAPEIIGFCNELSYDGKMIPLHVPGYSAAVPAVVKYFVPNGTRTGKENHEEAEAVIDLLESCLNQPEYEGKTFGIISMLGEEQAKLIQQELYTRIGPAQIEERKILCGIASQFQGDERDVVFLSLVDSPRGNASGVRKMDFGQREVYRKRYNVAVSRAREQLFVVTSLDSAADLKPGDIRKRLLDYADTCVQGCNLPDGDPEDDTNIFANSLADGLKSQGFHCMRNIMLGGNHRLNIAIAEGNHMVAIECISGKRDEEDIVSSLECRTMLERAGWTYISVRALDYCRNSRQAMEKIKLQLLGAGIRNDGGSRNQESANALLKRVLKGVEACRNGREQEREKEAQRLREQERKRELLDKMEKEQERKHQLEENRRREAENRRRDEENDEKNSPGKIEVSQEDTALHDEFRMKGKVYIDLREYVVGMSNPAATGKQLEEAKEVVREMAVKAAKIFQKRVNYWAPKVGVDCRDIIIRIAKGYWGTCRNDGQLVFNAVLADVGTDLLDAVVVHELCHRIYMDHQEHFYEECRRVMPDYDKRIKKMNKAGYPYLEKMLNGTLTKNDRNQKQHSNAA